MDAFAERMASLSGALLMLAVTVLYALGNVYVRAVPAAEAFRQASMASKATPRLSAS